MDWQIDNRIVKREGLCLDRCKWKYCPYYMVKRSAMSGVVMTYTCSLFEVDKNGHESVAACNTKYGITYDGMP